MKRLGLMLGCLLLIVSTAHPQIDQSITVVDVNSAAAQTNSTATIKYGWLDRVRFDFTGTTVTTGDLAVVVSATGWSDITILSVTGISSDVEYAVRDLAVTEAGADITGAAVMYPIMGRKITVITSNFETNASVASMKVQLFLSPNGP